MIVKYKQYIIALISLVIIFIFREAISELLVGIQPIIPPILAIVLALAFKNVFIALFTGCFVGYFILSDYNVIVGSDQAFMSFIKVFEDNDNTIVILLVLLLGGLIHLIQKSGGINGFVESLIQKRSLIKSKRGANVFTWMIGVVVFTSGTLSNLITGTIARPLSDAMKVSHEKLAYIVHSTSTPVCVLIPLSGWGAYMLGLIEAQGISNGTEVLVKSIAYNFYAILAALGALFFAYTNKDFGLMKKAEIRASTKNQLDDPRHANGKEESQSQNPELENHSSWLNVFAPLIAMIVIIILALYITGGEGGIIKGDGMKSILWGVILSTFLAMIMYKLQKIFKVRQMIKLIFAGCGEMVSVAAILMFAFSMGDVVNQLEAGAFLISKLEHVLIPELLPAIVFIISCIISFATGTSMGAMAVIMPLAIPMGLQLEISIPLLSACVFGGCIFGDHLSPISDTTVLSCATTGCDVMDHVRTQMPYGLLFGGISVVLFLIAGFWL
ncbi:Na+/H+ antiporter NhaC family protein [Marinifilum caeruleilacunae]|uniref:Sodium:proton antiporter n=1 Tax=Marinifilum caeruleilacunae TaxID=2499076 RepID=A0ABX1WQH8_9BACT|nr:Na+/H+ antiporter NhaC family protein [Marinifilum caeruleilacunae]NOU58348.1 sodium:proton antiporter [Marinifilum caeruleilacunae]